MTAPVATVRRWVGRTVVLAALLVSAGRAQAQLTVSGDPASLVVQSAAAGGLPMPATDASTSYGIFVFSFSQRKIVAQLNAPMPAGTTLSVMLQAPNTGTSQGLVPLGTTARDVVTGITFAWGNRAISYQFSATPAAGVIPPQSRTVTFTIVAGP